MFLLAPRQGGFASEFGVLLIGQILAKAKEDEAKEKDDAEHDQATPAVAVNGRQRSR